MKSNNYKSINPKDEDNRDKKGYFDDTENSFENLYKLITEHGSIDNSQKVKITRSAQQKNN
ncbi:hypothetical protein BC2926_01850 [Bacillus cereus]|nr:hypothetical protein BC2926_01850 [Bacillus cereus]